MPTPNVDTSPAPTSGGGRLGAFIGLLGGAAAIVGAFLTWVTITPGGAPATDFAGWTLTNDAKIVVGVGALAVVVSVIALVGSARAFARIVLALCGLGLVGVGIYEVFDLLNKFPDRLEAAGFQDLTIKAPQLGLILVLAGGGIAIVGALAMRAKKAAQPLAPTPGMAGSPNSSVPTTPPPPFA